LDDEDQFEKLVEQISGLVGERRPVAVVGMFVLRALGQPPFADLPLEDLVTPESRQNWDDDELASVLRQHAFYTGVEYLSPQWARVLLPQAEPGEGPHLVDEPREVMSLAFYLRYDEGLRDWRIHLLGPPNVRVEELP